MQQPIQQQGFFITGTDTDAGKTVVSCALLYAASQLGYPTLGLKPIAAGCEYHQQGFCNDDALALQRYSSINADYKIINPVALKPAIAPHIAARQAGISLDASALARHCQEALSSQSALAVVEGAGGWLVPLNDEQTMADLAYALKLPVILVVGMRLGCINHALLTVAAIKHSGLTLAGWVANQLDPNMSVFDDNVTTLKQRISAPCLGVVPFMPKLSIEQAAIALDIGKLLPPRHS